MHGDGAFLYEESLELAKTYERRWQWRSLALLLVSGVMAAEELLYFHFI